MIESLRIKSVSKIKNLTAIFKKKQEAAAQAALQAKLEHENSVMTVSAAVSTADHRSNQPFAQGQGIKTFRVCVLNCRQQFHWYQHP